MVERPIDAICCKAMALRPEDRYASCRLLADDIERALADLPVTAYAEPILDTRHALAQAAQALGGRGGGRSGSGRRRPHVSWRGGLAKPTLRLPTCFR